MGKKLDLNAKKAVETRLSDASSTLKKAEREVAALPLDPASQTHTAEDSTGPGGKPCGTIYDAQDSVQIALLELGGRPCGGGKPC